MTKLADHLRLTLEPSDDFLSPAGAFAQHFDGDSAADHLIEALVDRTHAAFADLSGELIPSTN
jgi:hypothetical protein